MNVVEFAKTANIPHQTLHQIIHGFTKSPHKKSLKRLSKKLQLSVKQLKGNEPIPEGLWTDLLLPTHKDQITKIPLITWSDVKKLPKDIEIIDDKYIINSPNLNTKCFALTMNNSSMEPIFLNKSTLIFDPDKQPTDRSFILASIGTEEVPVFRQLLIDIDHQYLKPINPELSSTLRTLTKEDRIIATLVESRRSYDTE